MEQIESFSKAIYNSLIKNDYWVYLKNGLVTTVIVTLFALLIGFFLGLFISIIRTAHKDLDLSAKTPAGFFLKLANSLVSLFVTFIRGTPTTIQLLIMFNIFLVGLDNLKLVAILTFGLNSSAYMSEIFRGGIQTVSKGEREAARSLGMGYVQSLRLIVLPQAFRSCLPALGNEVITLFKETSISGFIGLIDLTRGSTIIVSQTFTATVPYFAAALIYLLVVMVLEFLFRRLEKRFDHA